MVTFKGFDFTAYLDGELEAIETPGEKTRGRGALSFRQGKYRGYGQDLTIDPGRLIFAGPINNPSLDVLAYRKAADNTRAGFKVTGTVQAPVVEL